MNTWQFTLMHDLLHYQRTFEIITSVKEDIEKCAL